MIRVADYIAKRIAQEGVKHVFMLTGGGAMHLNDAIGRCEDLTYICHHHEQACAMAAEGYARITGNLGVVCVTTGPGGTNTMTGLLGQWLDSIPTLYVSGQVRFDTTVASTGLPLRQLGDQEANIVKIVESITKYAVMVTDPLSIRYHLEKAMTIARTGRPGPVWVDVPLNVQASLIDENDLQPYDPAEDVVSYDMALLEKQVDETIRRLQTAERPVILGGVGVRLANAHPEYVAMLEKLNVPVLNAWNAIDLLPNEHALYAGRPSTLGQRGANFVFQNSDLLLSVGCRLNVRQIGYTFASVARAAYKIVVDADATELQKPTLKPDLPIHADARLFIDLMNQKLDRQIIAPKSEWLEWSKERNQRYPVVLPEYREHTTPVNPYVFSEELGNHLSEGDVIVSSDGSACVVPIQAMPIKNGQRYVVNSGCAAMGYGLPASIGACIAHGKTTICLEGDGSIQLNIQELQTVVHHQLPLKIFVFNNQGYLSIRTTQTNFFNGNLVGEGPRSGVTFPDLVKLATAYGIPAVAIRNLDEMSDIIQQVLQTPGPVLCDVHVVPDQLFMPRVSSAKLPDGRMVSKPLEDLFPFLEREEFLSNMLIPPWEA